MGSSTYEVESQHAMHGAGHWIAMRRTSMHYNEDTLVARKGLRNAGRKQENPIVFVSLDGIKWRVREAHDVETKKKDSSHRSTVYVTSPRHVYIPTPDLRPCGCLAREPCACEVFSSPLPHQILSVSTVIVNGMWSRHFKARVPRWRFLWRWRPPGSRGG